MTIIQLTPEELQQMIKSEFKSALATVESRPEDELLTREATAEYLEVSLPTLNAWEKNGYIKAIRYGSRVYFNKAELTHKR